MAFEAAYFEANYRDYEAQNPPRKLAFYVDLVTRFAPPELPRRLHDVGCAFGRFLAALPADWQVYGSDVSAYAVDRARQAVPRGQFQVTDGGVAAWPEPMAVVTAFDVLEHLPDPDAVAQRLKAQLLPGGRLVFVVPVYDGLSGPLIRALDHDPTHLQRWPRRGWLEWAGRHFQILEWCGVLRYLLPGRRYLHLVTRAGRWHTPAIAVVCRRP
jgi:SAM-dependent methyltransferase